MRGYQYIHHHTEDGAEEIGYVETSEGDCRTENGRYVGDWIGVVTPDRSSAIEQNVTGNPTRLPDGRYWAHWETYERVHSFETIRGSDLPTLVREQIDQVASE